MKIPWCIALEEEKKAMEEIRQREEMNAPHTNDMEKGDWGYILPWLFDFDNFVPLGNVRLYPDAFGTHTLRIEKVSDKIFMSYDCGPKEYKDTRNWISKLIDWFKEKK